MNASYWPLQAFSTLILPSASTDSPLQHSAGPRISKMQQKCRKCALRAGAVPAGALTAIPHSPSLRGPRSQRGGDQVTAKSYWSDKCGKAEVHAKNFQVQRGSITHLCKI